MQMQSAGLLCVKLFTIIMFLSILPRNGASQSAALQCLIGDLDGCDYTDVNNDIKTQSLVINAPSYIELEHCSTEEEILAAFQDFMNNVVDQSTRSC